MSSLPIAPVGPAELLSTTSIGHAPMARPAAGASFAQMVTDGLDAVNRKIVDADAMVRAFALDDSIPVHQATFALEEARMSVELMMQVRGRLVEGYQELMRMQL